MSKSFTKISTVVLLSTVAVLGLSGCAQDERVKLSEEATVMPYQTPVATPMVDPTARVKPETLMTPAALAAAGSLNIDYENNIVLDVPKKDFTKWEGTSSEKVIVNFVKGTEEKAPMLEGLMSGTAEVTLTNTDTKEEIKVTITVVYK